MPEYIRLNTDHPLLLVGYTGFTHNDETRYINSLVLLIDVPLMSSTNQRANRD
jgi:hypothetical protein